MNFNDFKKLIQSSNAIRRRNTLHPIGGSESYVAPPTYLDSNNKAVHVFETRKINGNDVRCVLLDSVQSQANRLEESLERAISAGELSIPNVLVDFRGTEISDVGTISSLSAPHRIFDAILRDSNLGKDAFPKSEIGVRINNATPRNALPLFQYSPTTLVFGGWNSSGELGGNGSRFQRCIVSEIIGVNVPVITYSDRSGREVVIPHGKKPAGRMDPLRIEKMAIYRSKENKTEWSNEKSKIHTEQKKPSEINHGNIAPSITEQGVTIDHAKQITVITLAGLRRLSFPDNGNVSTERDLAAWTVLAAIALCAVTQHDKAGYSLRSRCDLCLEKRSRFEIINNDGKIIEEDITAETATDLLKESTEFAKSEGLPWEPEPVKLKPQDKLVELVSRSRKTSGED